MEFASFNKVFAIVLIASITSAKENTGDPEYPIVHLPELGTLQGTTITSAWTQRKIYHFVDVRYGEAPSGPNRFKEPIPVKPWNGTIDVTQDGIGCPSVFSLSEFAEYSPIADLEDCLSLTISTTNLTAKQPVMVYIHGEYLYEGNNLEGNPRYLLEKDIILVVPQYRLGPFGFLSTQTPEIPGNAGVLDIVLALQWIQQFIQNFGGDPDRVTVFGQVGGAAIAHLLTFSPAVPSGLLHQVIYHSGSAMSPIFFTKNPTVYALDIAGRGGCTNSTEIEEINKCLMSLSSIQLLEAFKSHAQELAIEGIGHFGGMQFTIGGPSEVLPLPPAMILVSHVNFSIPTMGGAPKNAGTRSLKEIYDVDFEGQIPDEILNGEDYINHIMSQTLGLDENGALTNYVTKELFTTAVLKNGTFKIMLPGLIDLAGSLVHKSSVLYALRRNARYLPEKTFLYSFDYKGEFNRYPDFDDDFDIATPFTAGVSLTDENIYLFPYPTHVCNLNPVDRFIAEAMVELWTNFATNGVPSVPGELEWPPMTGINGPYMKIDYSLSVGEDYFHEFTATVNDERVGLSLVRDEIF